MSEWAWACEGHTWGPRRRASAFPDAVAAGQGPRVPVLASGQRWRSVQWCTNPNPLAGFAAVAGDPSVCVLADRDAYVVGVHIAGQDHTAGCFTGRKPDALWDAEALPLHPWAGAALPSRRAVRDAWAVDDDTVVIGYLNPSWASRIFDGVRHVVQPGVRARRIIDATELVGCDVAIVAAGWGSTWEARWSGVPYLSVHLNRRDHSQRANATVEQMMQHAHNVVRRPDLPDTLTPRVPDHREQFRAALLAHT